MTALAFSASPPAKLVFFAPRAAAGDGAAARRSAKRTPRWAGLVLALFALTAPDCCITGHHAVGLAMGSFGSICGASR